MYCGPVTSSHGNLSLWKLWKFQNHDNRSQKYSHYKKVESAFRQLSKNFKIAGFLKRNFFECTQKLTFPQLLTWFHISSSLLFITQALGVLKEKAVMFHGYAEDSQREGEEL